MPNDTLAEFQKQAGYYLNRMAEKERVLLDYYFLLPTSRLMISR